MKTAWTKLVMSVLIAIGTIAIAGPAQSEPLSVGSLGVGDSVFWNGPYIHDESDLAGADTCGEDPCFLYQLEVTEPARRLRVAMDAPPDGDDYTMTLRGPNGEGADPPTGDADTSVGAVRVGTASMSVELFVSDPTPGTWTIEVDAFDPVDSAFRMRALLDNGVESPKKTTALLPNLRLEPAFDFTFHPAAATSGDTRYGDPFLPSCLATEIEDGATRCLRFAFGPQNGGVGPLDLRFSPLLDTASGAEGQMFQAVHYSDGSVELRRAGTYVFHVSHAHYHANGFTEVELYRVLDAERGELEQVGAGKKVGFCLGDSLMNTWEEFIQGPRSSSRDTCKSPDAASISLSPGWTDIYTQDSPSNYVDMAGNPDGLYVLRTFVDRADNILEDDETDNVSYSYIRMTGDQIELIERGYGLDPWDPHADPVADWWEALRPTD